MGSQFKRLKRYNATWNLIRAVVLAVATALLLAGILLVLHKLRIVQVGVVFYILAVAAGGAAGVAAWLLMRRSDLHLAEVIDQEHAMRERVQTMIAYRNEDSAMLQMQREDTERRLTEVKRAGVRAWNVGVHAGALALAFVVFMTGLIMPAKAVQTDPGTKPQATEPIYEASPWQKAALEDLIEHVEASQMTDAVKTPVAASLTELRQLLDTPAKVSVVHAKIISAMQQAYTLTDEANSNDDMHKVLSLMSHKVKAYLSYCLGNLALEDYDEKMDMAQSILMNEIQLGEANLTAMGQEIQAVLQFSDYDSTDSLYAAVEAFGNEITAAGAAQDKSNIVDAKQLTGEAIYNLRTNAALALNQQWLTKEEALYVVKTLAEIFSISGDEIPGDPDREYELDTSEPPPDTGGSQGTGEMQYPSDDKVFDYENNTHVPYPEILKEYLQNMTNDAMDGKFSDEIEAFLRKYFGNLQTNNDED